MKQYLIIAVTAIVVGAYFFCWRMGRARCELNAVHNQSREMVNVFDIKRNTDEKVFNTGVRDIRRILHTKYTIAE
ncbi:MAG: hypothetical protein J5620_04445 [Alphaproteobacteria bacterium]|nr:hypothetical protein [Alphaproteobacteria bacterium]